jgi:DNA-binding LytR/AlgR family response regulator
MNVLIIEDEALAAERLQILIKNYDPGINILASLESIEESIQWLQTKKHPDLIFLDIHLSDGYSFEIFKQVNVMKPVIFITAFDDYALDAFRLLSIDYILKPVTAESLANSINKYKDLTGMAVTNYALLNNSLKDNFKNQYKNRFLAKIGQRSFFIHADEVGYLYSDNKIVYLFDKEGNRFVINYTLDTIEPLLDPHDFFRINRKTIVHSKAIAQIKPYFNNRLKVIIKNVKLDEEIIVSRERVKRFKEWAES